MKHFFRLMNIEEAQKALEALGQIGSIQDGKFAVEVPEELLGSSLREQIDSLVDTITYKHLPVYWDNQRFHCANTYAFSYIAGRDTYEDVRIITPIFDNDVVQATHLNHSWVRYDQSGNQTDSGHGQLIIPATPLIRWYWHIVENHFGGEEKKELKDLMFQLKD